MDNSTCPFISQTCSRDNCRFWISSKNDCLIKVVAEITLERHEFMDRQNVLDYELRKLQTLENDINFKPVNQDNLNFESDGEIGSY